MGENTQEEHTMTIFKVYFYAYEIGGADFLHSFFSTVASDLKAERGEADTRP